MARYESIMKISGTIDNLVFYQLNGVNVVRKKSGFNTADYKKKPSYKKVRENSSEFGHCSKSGKMIREALKDYLKENGDKYLYQKFTKLMTKIKDLDKDSERGKRTVQKGLEHPEARILLQNFSFGNYENVQKDLLSSEGLFSLTFQKTSKTNADEIELISLKPDFKNYETKIHIQNLPIKPGTTVYEFEKQPDQDSAILYFAILKKEGKILKLGFI